MKTLIATTGVLGIVAASSTLVLALWFFPRWDDYVPPEKAAGSPCTLERSAVYQRGLLPYFTRTELTWSPQGCGPEGFVHREHFLLGGLSLSVLVSLAVLGGSVFGARALVNYTKNRAR
jgi:hypothetical protein